MIKRYSELVGLQVTFSRVVQRYRLAHYYRWRSNGKTTSTGTVRGYDMHRHIPSAEIMRNFRDAYAPAILSIWQRVTKSSIAEYYQFVLGATPREMGLIGEWQHWAEM